MEQSLDISQQPAKFRFALKRLRIFGIHMDESDFRVKEEVITW